MLVNTLQLVEFLNTILLPAVTNAPMQSEKRIFNSLPVKIMFQFY